VTTTDVLERWAYRAVVRVLGSSPSQGYQPGVLTELVTRCSPMRSLRATLRCGAPVLVARGARLRLHRTASVRGARGSVLMVGVSPMNTRATLVEVAPGGVLEFSGAVTIMSGCYVHVDPGARLTIGSHTFLNADTTLWCAESVTLGEGCAISWNVSISDSDVHTVVRGGRRATSTRPVHIDDHVWLGAGATVLKGVHVGRHGVVGAGSVVRDSVPANSLASGNPARVVADDVSWEL
jgi:acetyltransferase-like isoleucine patch superfamily enzyme